MCEVGGSWDYKKGWHHAFDRDKAPLPSPIGLPPSPGPEVCRTPQPQQQGPRQQERINVIGRQPTSTVLGSSMSLDCANVETGMSSPLPPSKRPKIVNHTAPPPILAPMTEEREHRSNIDIEPKSESDDMSISLRYIKSLGFYKDQLVAYTTLPSREAKFGHGKPNCVHAFVWQCINENLGYTRLYRHQHEAIDAVMAGRHVALSTSTASGKSLVYNAAVLSRLCESVDQGKREGRVIPRPTALYMFPTKALAQDQLRALRVLCGIPGGEPNAQGRPVLGARVSIVDGDTGLTSRQDARENSDIILTNPDMLHCTILPCHTDWRDFLRRVRFVPVTSFHAFPSDPNLSHPIYTYN